jgi:ABC-type multidrug transport system ATPase subunit
MKTCTSCGQGNAEEHQFCEHCGTAFPASPTATGHEEETVRWTGTPVRGRGSPHRTVPVDALFAARSKVVIGRAGDCDVCLPHPTVSRRHAELERLPDGRLRLSDTSRNGVFLDGERLEQPRIIRPGERIGIGPFLFSLEDGALHSFDSSRSLRLEARQVEKVVALPGGRKRKLLDGINLAVEPGEFVGLLGPSGSGKSTLMDCLNGRRRATGGRVLANGEDFYRHFDNFRQSLGYVPQKDIVHTQLTVARALLYTAQLRLPTDTSPAELKKRVEDVIHEMELDRHRDTLVGSLSGGQIKRVSLGAELLAQPCLLYVDEATSGLDAGTEARMMHLFRRLADEGRSLLCITHNVENVDCCHLVLVLVEGRLVYYGPPAEAPAYFGVRRISDIYDRLAEKDAAAWEKAFRDSPYYRDHVAARLKAPVHDELPRAAPARMPEQVAAGKLPPPPPAGEEEQTVPAEPFSHSGRFVLPESSAEFRRPRRRPRWHQFRVLTARYAELVRSDRRGFWMMLLQAPAVGLLLLLAFVNSPFQEQIPAPRKLKQNERDVFQALQHLADQVRQDQPLAPEQVEQLKQVKLPASNGKEVSGAEVLQVLQGLQQAQVLQVLGTAQTPILPDQEITNPKHTYMLLSILVIIVFWFGCNNAAKEIVKEEAIYTRERAVNLGILPYLGSKFLVLSLISAFQVLLLMLLIYGSLNLLHLAHLTSVPPREYCLDYLPQYGVLVLLAMTGVATGLLLSACVNTPDRANALLPYVLIPQIILAGGMIPIHHGVLHVLAVTISPVYWAYRAVHRGSTMVLPPDFPLRQSYNDSVTLACAALAVQMLVLLLATAWFLRRKDVTAA